MHAHIRYAESLAKLGKADELLQALLMICPLNIQKTVPNAAVRQSNAYFSSSDGDFLDRYEAGKRYGELKNGTVSVKGGWRIYSSGPGIYINQVISYWLLGGRYCLDDLVLDLVIAKELDGLEFQTMLEGRTVCFHYYVERNGHTPHRIVINGEEQSCERVSANAYRTGGILLDRKQVNTILKQDGMNHIHLYL